MVSVNEIHGVMSVSSSCSGSYTWFFVRGAPKVLSVPKFTENLYCICLSTDLNRFKPDAVQICANFWDTQYLAPFPNAYVCCIFKKFSMLFFNCNSFLVKSKFQFFTVFFLHLPLDVYISYKCKTYILQWMPQECSRICGLSVVCLSVV